MKLFQNTINYKIHYIIERILLDETESETESDDGLPEKSNFINIIYKHLLLFTSFN